VDTAIRVCRQVSLEDALTLAKKHRRHEWYLKLQLEDKQEYEEVLEYISNLPFSDAEANLKKCGSILLQHAPQQTTDLLKRLCTDYRPNEQPLIDQVRNFDFNAIKYIKTANSTVARARR
jgi:vacuolar protein sorting-associated protein 11